MGSLRAKNFAYDYLDKIRKKEKPNITQLSLQNGYSMKCAIQQKPMRTKTFKRIVTPVIEQLDAIRQQSLSALAKKDHTKEKFRDLVDGVDKFTRNVQLLSGQATDNVEAHVIMYGSDDFLALQLEKENNNGYTKP